MARYIHLRFCCSYSCFEGALDPKLVMNTTAHFAWNMKPVFFNKCLQISTNSGSVFRSAWFFSSLTVTDVAKFEIPMKICTPICCALSSCGWTNKTIPIEPSNRCVYISKFSSLLPGQLYDRPNGPIVILKCGYIEPQQTTQSEAYVCSFRFSLI